MKFTKLFSNLNQNIMLVGLVLLYDLFIIGRTGLNYLQGMEDVLALDWYRIATNFLIAYILFIQTRKLHKLEEAMRIKASKGDLKASITTINNAISRNAEERKKEIANATLQAEVLDFTFSKRFGSEVEYQEFMERIYPQVVEHFSHKYPDKTLFEVHGILAKASGFSKPSKD